MYKIILIFFVIQNISWGNEIIITKEKALKIAEEKLTKTYGKRVLNQRPFIASLEGSIWKIHGTYYCEKQIVCKGEVAFINISATDGSILTLQHEK